MRTLVLIVTLLCAVGCQQPDWPAVAPVAPPAPLTADDLAIITAAIQGTVGKSLGEGRTPLQRNGPAPLPLPTIVLADRTLRICDPLHPGLFRWEHYAADQEGCRESLPQGARTAHERNRVSLKIEGALGSAILLAASEDLPSLNRDRPNHFYEKYPPNRYTGRVLVTAPVHLDGGRALIYVEEWAASGRWIELSFDRGRWVISRTLGSWLS
jgi:hypothetical protein